MKLAEYKKKIKKLKSATLCFLVKNNQVLLALKKRGFGEGLWNGAGGKVNYGESIKQAAKREASEEINVIVSKLKKMAVINFFFPHKPEWSQQVTVFLTDSWKGEPEETGEMKPKWFKKNKLPFKEMWWDDEYWLPLVLDGKKVVADFMFDDNKKVIEQAIKTVSKL